MSDIIKAKAWEDLAVAAKSFASAQKGDKAAGQALSDAAKAWASAVGPALNPRPATRAAGHSNDGAIIPFGRSKGTPVSEADTKDLQWVAGALRQSIEDPAKEKWAPANRRLLEAIEHELETR